MVAAFTAMAMFFRLPLGLSLTLSAVIGMLVGGAGVDLRHLVEGSFLFFDTILVIVTAIVFLKSIQASGLLDTIASGLLRTFYRRKAPLLLTSMLIIMFPAMFTGTATTSILSSGPLIAPVLRRLGLPKAKTGAMLAVGGTIGMIAPPVNILVMIMGSGVDMPYVGVTAPLLMAAVPLALFTSLWLGLKDIQVISYEEMTAVLPHVDASRRNCLVCLPLIVVIGCLVIQSLHLPVLPDLGIPGVFLIGSLIALISGRRFNYFRITQEAVREAMPILSLLAGVGVFIQAMTITGGRGWLVLTSLSAPAALFYVGLGLSMPLFGGVSVFGSASILGVPFMLALLGKNALITAAALSTVAGVGNMVPPSAIAARFAAQVVDEPDFLRVLRACLVPMLFMLAVGIGMLLLSPWLEGLL
jgi:TRAP-type C4-dicarboxylate transport system permease large subunit